MALASGIGTSIKLFLMTAIYTEKQNGRRFHAREHRLGFGDARELKNFGEHSPTANAFSAFISLHRIEKYYLMILKINSITKLVCGNVII